MSETFLLFRGENPSNKGGLHFSTDKDWAKNFGDIILEGTLPVGCKIKLLTGYDFEEAYNSGITSEQQFWNSVFIDGYDAILGTDAMNSSKIDVIIHPKHLENFKS